MPIKKAENKSSEKYEVIDTPKLINFIKNENWLNVYDCDNPETCVEIFLDIIKKLIKKATILKSYTSRNKKRKPWMTNGIVKSICTRDTLFQQHIKRPQDIEIKNQYINYRNKINSLVKKAKSKYLKNLMYNTEKVDSKKLWEGVKTITNNSTKCNKEIKYILKNATKITNKSEMAKQFNNYYANVGHNLAQKIDYSPPLASTTEVTSSLFLYPTDVPEIKKFIKELKVNKAPGKDGITPKIIKDLEEYISKPLCYIFNKVLETGVYPSPFKEAIIKPLYKSGDKNLIENYRPISIISNFGKLLEKIIKVRLVNYLDKHNLISNCQYGFQEKKSTNDAMAKLVSYMYNALDQSKPSLCVFLDLAKAFDTVSHEQLLSKLESIGIRGNVLDLFKNYLGNRKQYVKIDNSLSTYELVTYGVPQGTVLGPVLFIIYMNDILTQKSAGEIISFADDTAIFYSSETWEMLKSIVEKDLKQIKNYFDSKILTINYNKTHYLPITSLAGNLPNYKSLQIRDGDKVLEIASAEKVKYLGIYIDQHLRWQFHIQALVQKLRGLIYKFRQLKQVLNIKELRTLYIALVESILRYGIIAWGGGGVTYLKPLDNIQKRILKILYGKHICFPSETLFQISNLFTIKQLYYYNCLIHQYKTRNTAVCISHDYNTRCREMGHLKTDRKVKAIGQKFFGYIGIKLYNGLPKCVKDNTNIYKFKRFVKIWIKAQGTSICID